MRGLVSSRKLCQSGMHEALDCLASKGAQAVSIQWDCRGKGAQNALMTSAGCLSGIGSTRISSSQCADSSGGSTAKLVSGSSWVRCA